MNFREEAVQVSKTKKRFDSVLLKDEDVSSRPSHDATQKRCKTQQHEIENRCEHERFEILWRTCTSGHRRSRSFLRRKETVEVHRF